MMKVRLKKINTLFQVIQQISCGAYTPQRRTLKRPSVNAGVLFAKSGHPILFQWLGKKYLAGLLSSEWEKFSGIFFLALVLLYI